MRTFSEDPNILNFSRRLREGRKVRVSGQICWAENSREMRLGKFWQRKRRPVWSMVEYSMKICWRESKCFRRW